MLILIHTYVQQKQAFCVVISENKTQNIFHLSIQGLGLGFSVEFGNASYLFNTCFGSEMKTYTVPTPSVSVQPYANWQNL